MARKHKRELVSQREYARRHGVSHAAVQHAISAGRISTIEGKIDPAKADREWQRNTDLSKPRNRISGEPKRRRPAGEPPGPMQMPGPEDHGGDGTATGYARARAAREVYQAQLTKLDLERQREVLVRADEVKIAAFSLARKTRDQLIALGERLVAVVPPEIQHVVEEEIERICQEIAVGKESDH